MSEVDWEQESGDGIWKDLVNKKTGEHSIKEIKARTVWQSCPKDECVFESVGNRELRCKKCGLLRRYVLGKEKLVDGKLVPITYSNQME